MQDRCGGCDYLGQPAEWQRVRKTEGIVHLLRARGLDIPAPEWIQPADFGTRDRLDFILENGRFGLTPKGSRDVTDIDECGQLSPALAAWLTDFRRHKLPVGRGSVRLRVGPNGARGAWLDFANEDVKDLFDQRHALEGLLDDAFVEIGQRRKKLVSTPERLKLQDAETRPWFETWAGGNRIPLHCFVGSFTQPSLLANKAMVEKLESWAKPLLAARVFEYGCGIGNLSFALMTPSVESYATLESDRTALDCFHKNFELFAKTAETPELHLETSVARALPFLREAELLLVDPPRSGLSKDARAQLADARGLKHVLSVSCYPESFADDAVLFNDLGFRMKEWALLDQFPQTSHVEILSSWTSAG